MLEEKDRKGYRKNPIGYRVEETGVAEHGLEDT